MQAGDEQFSWAGCLQYLHDIHVKLSDPLLSKKRACGRTEHLVRYYIQEKAKKIKTAVVKCLSYA